MPVNEYRDGLRAELVRRRNHLWSAFVAVELLTFLLLAFVLNMHLLPPSGDGPTPWGKNAIVAATSFYLVGALVGIFSWAYSEFGATEAVEDFGLYYPRLVISSALSGLAAVGGVFLTVMLAGSLAAATVLPSRGPAASQPAPASRTGAAPATQSVVTATATQSVVTATATQSVVTAATQPQTTPTAEATPTPGVVPTPAPTPGDIFNLDGYPYGLFLAFVFGFSPGLLIDRLKSTTDRIKADLKTSQAA